MNTDSLLEQAHLAILRHEYMQARHLLDSVLQAEAHNIDAIRLMEELREKELAALSPRPVNPALDTGSFWGWLLYGSWTPRQFFYMIVLCPAVGIFCGEKPFARGLATHFAWSTTYYAVSRGHSSGGYVSIWPALVISAAFILVGMASLGTLIIRAFRKCRQ